MPQSLLSKATRYALNQLESLLLYLGNGHVEIDSNGVDNVIRPSALGKKNWWFIGHEGAGQNAAVLYSLVENCRLHHLDPQAYLRAMLTALARHDHTRGAGLNSHC